MPESTKFKEPGADITAKASAPIVGRRFIDISGNRTGGGAGGLSTDLANVYQVAHCAAAADGIGVSAYDAASGALVKVYGGGIVEVTAGGVIAAGDLVKSDATGQAVTHGGAGVALGIAMTGAANGAICEVRLRV